MLQRARVPFEERDIFLHTAFAKELQARLPSAKLPHLFFNGLPLGVCDYNAFVRCHYELSMQDYKTVHELNENGVLTRLFADMPVNYIRKLEEVSPQFLLQRIKVNESGECGQCGGRGFITCTWCSGSKKSISNRFGRAVVSLKCTCCNENGLMRCTACLSTAADPEADA